MALTAIETAPAANVSAAVKSEVPDASDMKNKDAKRCSIVECRERLNQLVGAEETTTTCPDGTKLVTFVRRPKTEPKDGSKVMLVFAPLGQADLVSYLPLINALGDEYTYISWQYRGFFNSDLPRRERRVSIRDHAEDGQHVLKAAGFSHADVVIGHSLGVQVALEFVLLYPESASALILMNGSYGTVLNYAFQPFMPLPLVGSFAEKLVDSLISVGPSRVVGALHNVVTSGPVTSAMEWFGRNGASYLGGQRWLDMGGEAYLATVMGGYFDGITSNEHSSRNWLRGFQELHAHSVKHLLHSIEHPTLLLSGRLDYLTPSWIMEEMKHLMPNAEHKADWFSTHFSIVEHESFIVDEVTSFLSKNPVGKFKRCSSMHFVASSEESSEQ